VHTRPYGGVKPWLAILRTENDVEDNFAERLWHIVTMAQKSIRLNRAFSAGKVYYIVSLGRCPRLF